jgi:uncharacterized protein YbjT (DUF2867 family)
MNILVAGATGNVGRHIVQQLFEAGHHVRALTRNPAKANFPDAVEVVQGDLTQPETIAPLMAGMNSLHLINFGGDDNAPLQTGKLLMAMAEQAGIKRVTILGAGERGPLEQAVQASSLAWTILQPVEFMSNMLEWARPIQETGEVRQPFATRKSAIVHDADIAAVAVAALTQDGHGGQVYTITGPEALSPIEMTRIINEVTGQRIQFIEMTEAEAVEEWQAAGYPQEVIGFFLEVYGNTPPVGYTVVPTVEQVTGRPARTLAQWVAENADVFRVGTVA